MAQNISATNAFTTTYDAGVPEQTDNANIVQAFTEYHYGADYDGTGDPGGIEGHLTDIAADIVTHANASTTVHGVTGSVVGTTSTQTLTNKTITSPTISGATITSPTISGATITSPISTIATTTSSASYTLVLADQSMMIEISSASASNLTIPLNSSVAFPTGTSIIVLQTGAGQITVVPTGGVTANATPGLKTRTQWSMLTLIKRDTNTWVVLGDSAA